MRIERPAAELAGLINDYHVLDSEPAYVSTGQEHSLPNNAAIRFVLAEAPIAVSLGDETWPTLPEAVFFGPTTRSAAWTTKAGGVTIGATLTATGFARLFKADSSRFRDRLVRLTTLLDPALVSGIVARLRASDRGADVKGILDQFFIPLMSRPHRAEADIRTVARLLGRANVNSVDDAAAITGLDRHRLHRLSVRYFGFPTKTLLIRNRLLRSIVALKQVDRSPNDDLLIDAAYYDRSHFNRDSHRFLGMAPGQFLDLQMPYSSAVLRARALVLGAPLAVLDHQQ